MGSQMSLVKNQPIFCRWRNGPEIDGWAGSSPIGTAQIWWHLTNLTWFAFLEEVFSLSGSIFTLCVEHYRKKEKLWHVFSTKIQEEPTPETGDSAGPDVLLLDQTETTTKTWHIANDYFCYCLPRPLDGMSFQLARRIKRLQGLTSRNSWLSSSTP